MKRHYWFVYRFARGGIVEWDRPTGGIICTGWPRAAVLKTAWEKARVRFPCKPHEMLMVVEVDTNLEKLKAATMERHWEMDFMDFKTLMTVS